MVNCLIVGHGAREHAIAEALFKGGGKLFAFMSSKNAGLEDLSNGRIKIHSETDFKEIIEFCKEKKIDFAIIGPEAPLCVGIVDALEKAGISCYKYKFVSKKQGFCIFKLCCANKLQCYICHWLFIKSLFTVH